MERKILKIILLFLMVVTFSNASQYYYKGGKKVYLTPVKVTVRSVSKEVDFYSTSYGSTLGVSSEILVKLKANIDIDSIVKKYNINVIKKVLNNLYLVETSNKSNTLDISNKLYEDDNIIYAHPNFLKKRGVR